MNPNLYDVLTMCPSGKMWDYVRNIPNEPSKCNQWKHFHRMLSEHLKCFLHLPTGHIVGKMHMGTKCTQHVITGFQVPSPPVCLTFNSTGNVRLLEPLDLDFSVDPACEPGKLEANCCRALTTLRYWCSLTETTFCIKPARFRSIPFTSMAWEWL